MPAIARLTRHPGAVAVCLVLGGLALNGCSGGDQAESPDRSTAPAKTGSATPGEDSGRAEHIAGETVTKAPKLPSGEPLTQVASAKGNRELELGHITTQPLSVLVNCQGQGTLTVEVRPMGLSFPLECAAGEVSSTYNELRLKKSRENGVVSVTAPSSVRWSLTVGQ
ncbi:hypothetical protein [Streptomyces sp. NPDC004629]|uniref:hypothetical protein n=1 Tax=Streptomyces sp. NPDC004629 TaxID=3364705 RepID=UPI0036A7ACF1